MILHTTHFTTPTNFSPIAFITLSEQTRWGNQIKTQAQVQAQVQVRVQMMLP